MARLNFSFDDAFNLRLPFEDSLFNFAWANFARKAAFTRFRYCILAGYESEHKDLYKHRRTLIESPWDQRQTLKYIRQLVEETDDLDRFRNRIEGVLIDGMDLDEEQKQRLKLHFRSYNRHEEQRKMLARIAAEQQSNFSYVHDPTLLPLFAWNRDFTALRGQGDLDELFVRIDSGHTHVTPEPSPISEARKNSTWKRKANTGPAAQKLQRKRAKISYSPSSTLPTVDPVIEQWYTDPYNRHDPEGFVGTKLRKQVLTTALRNRGFRGNRINSIVSWLVRCRGRYKDYDELKGSSRRRYGYRARRRSLKKQHLQRALHEMGTKSMDMATTPTSNGNGRESLQVVDGKRMPVKHATGLSTYPSPISVRPDQDKDKLRGEDEKDGNDVDEIESDDDLFNVADTDEDEIGVGADADADADSEFYPFADPAERANIMQQIKEEIIGVRPSFHSSHAPGTQAYKDDYDDWRLEDLKRTQAFWNIIYGDDLDNAPEDASLTFTYFRDPDGIPRPDVQYPSQGLKKLKKCMVNGQEAWTEDDSFGLYVPTKRGRIYQDGIGDCVKQESEEAG